MKLITPISLILLALAAIVLVAPGALASDGVVYGHILGQVSATHEVDLTKVTVVLVNASNASEQIPGFSSAVDESGSFQFTYVPNGTYMAFAWGPHLSAGMSNNVTITDAVTYTAGIVLKPEPYYGNMTVTKKSIPLEGATTEITITVYDYWENPIGPGRMVTTHTTAGTLDPLYGLTDANSQFRTTLTSPNNGSYAEVEVFAEAWNGTYYPLQERITVVNATPTPSASPSPTAQPSVTPTVTPNATLTPTPSATPTTTATPTPGFEIALALIAIMAVAACIRRIEK